MAGGRSIRRNLTIWLMGPLVALSIGLLVDAFLDAQRRVTQVYDRLLAAIALSISEAVRVDDQGDLAVHLPFPTLAYSRSFSDDHLFYAVVHPATGASVGYPGLPAAATLPDAPGAPVYYDAIYRGTPVRVAMLPGQAASLRESSKYAVIVAETLGQRSLETQSMLIRSALRLSVLVCIASLIVWFGVSKGLSPLRNLEQSVRRRSPEDLRPITHSTPLETAALVDSINAFMTRLRTALEALQRFTGNVGHQLRTPLGVIQANVALARRGARDAATRGLLTEVESAVRDLGHLVSQLLLISRVQERRADQARWTPVDLNQIVAGTVRDRAPGAARSGVEMSLLAEPGPIPVRADSALIEGLLLNLIDNVERHVGQTELVIRTRRTDRHGIVEVEDDGPGVPPGVIACAFTRHSQDAIGHGLGLSISAEIAQHFGGDIAFQLPRTLSGTSIIFRLPLSDLPAGTGTAIEETLHAGHRPDDLCLHPQDGESTA